MAGIGDPTTLLVIIFGGLLVIFWHSQTKFQHKVLCVFHTQDLKRIEAWVPMERRHVRFRKHSRGKDYGMWEVRSDCFEWTVWDKGVNKFFPTMIPTIEFRWNNPNPVNPKTGQNTWHTPEARDAAWQEHQHRSFAAAAEKQAGKKERYPAWFFPLLCLGVCIIILFIVWQMRTDVSEIKTLVPGK
jgi:hypothetical protein